MTKTNYRWIWKLPDGSDRVVQISTYQSKETAREKALSYFPDDEQAREFITNTEPEAILEAEPPASTSS